MLRWLPENVSTYGDRVDGVIHLVAWIVGVWFALALGLLLYFAVRYRRPWQPQAAYVPARTRRSMAVVLVPVAAILVLDLVIEAASSRAWDTIKIHMPEPALTVRVIGEQYAWTIVHPGADNVLDTADDITELNVMHVPAGEVVQYELQAKEVIHSFFLPNLRLKQDAVPGRTVRGWFEATRPGKYQLVCAELCGLGHTNMRGTLEVQSPADYQAWVAAAAPEGGR